ncbi:hypothetical protein L1D61_26820 [Vibrio mediterranei]|uniref:WH2 domain-containing protein n=1 Tax=Vibrio mediterranei TaxID=689 RepID=A0A3G4VJW6_9VIBR|nr:WH2 domain-containing protein [Vibrio mediterranei]AYV25097.1 hypothetical protein ECB94_27830 [Vibrio mediterranei]MCG9790736.1 hypothetical protein [Vibrio mediterranei]
MQPSFQTQKTAGADNIHSTDKSSSSSNSLDVSSVRSVSEKDIHDLIEKIISLNLSSSIDRNNVEKLTLNLDNYLNEQDKSQRQLSSTPSKEAKNPPPTAPTPPTKSANTNVATQGREALFTEIRQHTGLRKTNLTDNTVQGTPPSPPLPAKSANINVTTQGREALFAEIRQHTGLRKTNLTDNTVQGTPPSPPLPAKSANTNVTTQGREALFAEIREHTGLRKTNLIDNTVKGTPPSPPLPAKSANTNVATQGREALFAETRKTSTQPVQRSNSNEGSNINNHNPLIDGMSDRGKLLLFENPDQILDQADQLADADKKAIAAFTSRMVVHTAKPDILGELKKQIGHLPANEVTEKHISDMPIYCQDYFSMIRPYTHDIYTSAPFGNALCRKAEKENYQKINAGSEMSHLQGKTPQGAQKGQQQTQWQNVAEVLEKLQINKRLEATLWHEKSGTIIRTPKESSSVFAEAQEKASKSLDNETRSKLLKNNYKNQVTAALKEDPIFSGLFAKIDKDAAQKLESEFRGSINNPNTLEKNIGDFVLNKLQTQCKAFTYVGLTAQNESLQQEIERLKTQLAANPY